MNKKTIESYIALFHASKLQSLSIKTETFEIAMEAPRSSENVSFTQDEIPNSPVSEDLTSKNTIVKAPIVGVFYTAASPGEAPFVRVGQKVKAGDPIGIIEAMKVMNEIVAPKSGIVETIFVKDKAYIEYDQPLIEIR